jgi:DNA-binding response OmpR family regulator
MVKKKIMIVDDEENLSELIKAIFKKEGFDVFAARSGQECLDKLKDITPDVILMDIMMPGMTGTETVEKIKSNPKTKNLKIIFLTVARVSEVGKNGLKDLGAMDYITKPFDNNDLVRRVKRVLG